MAVGFAAYNGTQENYLGAGIIGGVALYILFTKSYQEKAFEELRAGEQTAWKPNLIARIGKNSAGISLNYQF